MYSKRLNEVVYYLDKEQELPTKVRQLDRHGPVICEKWNKWPVYEKAILQYNKHV